MSKKLLAAANLVWQDAGAVCAELRALSARKIEAGTQLMAIEV
jgi:hypothetical protein